MPIKNPRVVIIIASESQAILSVVSGFSSWKEASLWGESWVTGMHFEVDLEVMIMPLIKEEDAIRSIKKELNRKGESNANQNEKKG